MAAQGGATKYDGMWASLFDEKGGFWGKYGPTTVARRETCFNRSQDLEECNWAGPSWPYETSRVLTGLSNFLTEYPAQQSKSAGMDAAHYTRLLRTYVRVQQCTHRTVTESRPACLLFVSERNRFGPGLLDDAWERHKRQRALGRREHRAGQGLLDCALDTVPWWAGHDRHRPSVAGGEG